MAIGSILGFLAVALGAFGAHALKAKVSAEDLEIFKTATHYQMFHAIVLLLIGSGLSLGNSVWLYRAGSLFVAGTVIFSGTLYLLVLTQARWLGAVTPIGGVALLVAWALLLLAVLKSN